MTVKNIIWFAICFAMAFNFGVVDTVAEDRPNILWITLEDTSTQFIGAYGNQQVKTPTIDRLASEGVRFTSAFATASVCSAARSTIITGVSTEALGTGHHRSRYPIPDHIKGFPSYLRQAGYYTANKQKTDYNTSAESRLKKESWDVCSGTGSWSRRKKGQPFFCVFNLMHSHQSRTMTWSWKKYKSDVYDRLSPEDRVSQGELEVPEFYLDSPEMRKQMSRVYNSLALTDKAVGKILDQLEKDRLRDDTIIFLYADHGEGLPNIKANSIAMSYRVPFVVWFPKKYQHMNPWGKQIVSDELISFEDLAPTVLSLAGVEIPDYMQGRPLIGPKRKPAPEFVFASRNRCGEGNDTVRSVTDGKYLYSRVFMPQYPAVKFHKYFDVGDISKVMRKDFAANNLNAQQSELFQPRSVEYLVDVRADRWEANNLADNPAHQKRLQRMRKAVFDRIGAIRDIHFLPEYELNRIAENGTAYEARLDADAYPLDKIVAAADLVGQGNTVISKQFKLLKDPNPTIRYWAAVGLHAQGENVMDKKDPIRQAMLDPCPSVQIEMASLAWELYHWPEAKEILDQQLHANDPYLVWQVLQSIMYMDEDATEILPLVDDLKERLKKNKKHPAKNSLVTNSLSVLDYKYRDAVLK